MNESRVEVDELSPGAWYDFTIQSVGVNSLKNTKKTANILLQTGSSLFYFEIFMNQFVSLLTFCKTFKVLS